MSDGGEPVTPPQDTGMPDSAETDPAALNSAEDLDEDRLRLDPLEEGMDPPEHWSEADRYGMTPFEQQQGESLDERVRQERPDVRETDLPERPVAATPDDELDETVDDLAADDVAVDAEPVPPDEDFGRFEGRGVGTERNADQADGPVVNARTPEDPEAGR
ncbi:hypothetical protein [Saccharomonospora glauca]|jgi:hypothetical protein|uniref:DUF5709 domain-containing protein n=1 Tax=Saccharomonospora glauca K62 TaxID=928724 RepID=I1D064_9PSEU|nr:hypothetical protein [Saccharomonospora glauca]EIE98338.1 hypothetical protein SacglDRAFT_01415 [Saccharomonospora glauca K62]